LSTSSNTVGSKNRSLPRPSTRRVPPPAISVVPASLARLTKPCTRLSCSASSSGPSVVASSIGSPITVFFSIASSRPVTTWSWTDSWTSSREPAVHTSPWLVKMAA
jgi:hypothetical protein